MADNKNQNIINSLVGPGAHFRGELSVKELLRIDGDFSGTIYSEARVLLGATSRFKGNIQAAEVVIGGAFKGDIFATKAVKLLSSALVIGTIYAPRLIVEEGVLLEAYCSVLPDIADKRDTDFAPRAYFSLKMDKSLMEAARKERPEAGSESEGAGTWIP